MIFLPLQGKPAASGIRIKTKGRGAINRAPYVRIIPLRSMIPRYTRPEMGRIWSEENSFQKWLDVEILAAEGLARLGKVPKAAIARIRKNARFDVRRIREIEREVKHEVIAFLNSVAESIGGDWRIFYF